MSKRARRASRRPPQAPARSSPNPQSRFQLRPRGFLGVCSAFVALSALLPYLPTLSSAWTGTDDTPLIVEDAPFLTSDTAVADAFRRPFFPSDGRRQRYYRPLVTASFAADAQSDSSATSTPPSPASFHRTNVVLHVVASLLVFALASAVGIEPLVAAASAVLFAVHPVTVQTVAWIPGRCDSLMAVLALASIVAWIRFDRGSSRRWLAAHIVCCALALLAKEAAVAIPAIVLSYSLIVSRNKVLLRSRVVWIGWAIAFAFWIALRSRAVGALGLTVTTKTALQAFPVLLVSFGKLLLPVDLDVLATLRDSALAPGVVALLGLVAASRWLSQEHRPHFVWATILVPVLSLIPTLLVSDFLILDNRLYLPLAGVAIGAGALLQHAVARVPTVRRRLALGCAMAVVALGMLTVRHARAFASPRAFSEAAVSGSPHLGLAQVNLGGIEYLEGNFDAAASHFRQALEENPEEPIAHNDLGLIYMNRGELDRAEDEFNRELRANANYPKAHFNLGLVLSRIGREDAAREQFERVVRMVPGDVQAWGELLKYWGTRDPKRATEISDRMEALGVKFESPASP